jgi:cytochrome c biogenesis protein CcmG, thiol:disulfide interchange protein DsbE
MTTAMLRLRSPFRAAALAVLVLVAAGAAAGCDVAEGAVQQGRPVPAYAGQDLAGVPVSLASLRGEVVMLNVWATWCYPCRKEMPSFQSLHEEFGPQGLRVVAVSIDSPGARAAIDEFLEEYGISFTIVHDGGQEVTRAFRTLGVPETFLIGRDGTLLKRWTGRIDGHSPQVRQPIVEALSS